MRRFLQVSWRIRRWRCLRRSCTMTPAPAPAPVPLPTPVVSPAADGRKLRREPRPRARGVKSHRPRCSSRSRSARVRPAPVCCARARCRRWNSTPTVFPSTLMPATASSTFVAAKSLEVSDRPIDRSSPSFNVGRAPVAQTLPRPRGSAIANRLPQGRMAQPPTFSDVLAARDRIAGEAVRTPLLHSPFLSNRLKARVYVKPECLQRTGSFKFRGAWNAVQALGETAPETGLRRSLPETMPRAWRRRRGLPACVPSSSCRTTPRS